MKSFFSRGEKEHTARARLFSVPRPMLRSPLLPLDAPAPDLPFLLTVVLLALFGTVTVFSAGYAYAAFRYGDAGYFMRRQILWLAVGLVAMFFSSHIRPSVYEALTPVFYAVTLLLLLLVLAIGWVGNGAQRWISVGPVTIQPSEIAKMTMVMMLARYFAVFGEQALDRKKKRNIFLYGTLFPGVILLLPILLVMLQKHLSCIIILGAIGLLTILAAGVGTRYIGIFTALGGVGVTCLALFTDYTKDRITVWQNPEAYPLTGGWQTLQGLMAIGSGGLFGLGLGKSVLKYCYISEPANDMIFTVLCEELGFLGAGAVLAIFGFLVYRGYRIALYADSVFARITAFGITTKIAVQVLLNVAVVTNTIPNTGISLPFFSYGGSSLVMLFFEAGMILSFSRYAKITK